MNNTKTTKRALWSSALALFLCFAMLLGTTYAWFTDSVTSANNIIKSGNLDIVLEYWNGTEWATVENSSEILDAEALWEPGYTEVAYLRIKNAGSLALKYQLGINIVSETAGVNVAGDSFKLSDYIYFDVVNGQEPEFASREAAMAYATETTLISAGYTKAGSLAAASDYVYLAMVVYMPTTVGNEANHNGTAPQINLGINILATQVSAESDSFGTDYDNDAAFISAPVERDDVATTGVNLKGANDVVITLTPDLINALPAEVEEIGMAVSDPVIENNTITFASIELVDQDGNVIDLEALNLEEEITVTLPLPENAPFADGETVMVYHDGEYVANAVVTADGKIVYTVAHLCEVTIGTYEELVETEDNIVEIATVGQLLAFAKNVNEGLDDYAGKTVVLTNDINLNNVNWTPIGNWDNAFSGTFDGNGKVISNLYINAPEGEGVGLFGVVAKATLQNVAIKNVKVTGYSQVAGVVGSAYPATISNCSVSGDVEIVAEWAYVAGIAGYCYYGTQVSGCSVVANEQGLIKSVVRNAVGGITAWLLEGDHKVTDCQVKNLDLVGWTNIGGITGFVHYSNTIANCSVENVNLIKTRVDGNPGIGLIAGGWSYSAKNAITLSGNTVKNATLEGTHIAYAAYNELYGSEYGGATTTNFVLENNTVDGIENNLLEVKVVKTASELKTAAAVKNASIALAANTTFEMGNFSVAEGVTLIGSEGSIITGTLTSTVKNVTIKNVYIKSGNAQRWAYASGTVLFENCTFHATSVYAIHYDGTTNADITYKNCKIIGWVAITGGHNSLTFDGCEVYGNGSYGVIRSYGVATIKNCTFDVANVNVNDVYQDGIHAVDCVITVENCTNVNGDVEDLFNVSGTGEIVIKP